jgi:hypothetical protein
VRPLCHLCARAITLARQPHRLDSIECRESLPLRRSRCCC